jgi:hypothetical protein
MDDISAFMQLSALLTGHYEIVATDVARALNRPVAEEYVRRLNSSYPDRLRKLLDAYKDKATGTPPPKIDDRLLAAFEKTKEFKAHEFVAKQIVNLWNFSQFRAEDKPDAPFVDGGFYERGLVWPHVSAHAIGFSHKPHGYWVKMP